MKLLQELLILREEAIETLEAADAWKDNKDEAKTYITNATYEARQIPDSKPVKYEVFSVKNNSRKLIGKFESDDFEIAYTPIRNNQEEDAEGYKTYRDAGDVEALRYQGDTVNVRLSDDEVVKLKKGDYLIRSTEDDEFVYAVEKAVHFEDDYTEQK